MEKTKVSAQELAIVGAVQPVITRYVVAEPLKGERAEQVYESVARLARERFPGSKAFSGHWGFDRETGLINGSSLLYLILANNPEVLGSMGLRTPTYEEGRRLDSQNRLTNGVYRDFELVGYDLRNPNADVANVLMKSANGRIGFPFKAHPKSLKLIGANTQYGLGIAFADISGVITGEKAQNAIDSCNYKSDSGVRRLYRGNWFWYAGWDSLAYSDDIGRVDWVCREVTRAEIESLDKESILSAYQAEVNRVVGELQTRRDNALSMLQEKE